MSEDHGMKERKMDNLNRMMIEANSYLEEKDQISAPGYLTEQESYYSRLQTSTRRLKDDKEAGGAQYGFLFNWEDLDRMAFAAQTDQAASDTLHDKYPKLWDYFRERDAEMNRIADYNAVQKVCHGVSKQKRDEARSRRDRIEQGKKDLAKHRTEKLQDRRAFFHGELKKEDKALKERLAELEGRKDALSRAERFNLTLELDARKAKPMPELEDPDSFSVLHLMKTRELSGAKEIRRKTMRLMSDDNLGAGFRLLKGRKDPLVKDGMPLLVEKGESMEEDVARLTDLTTHFAELNTKYWGRDPKKLEEQEPHFDFCFRIAEQNFERIQSQRAGKEDLFAGSIHPDKLLFGTSTWGGITINSVTRDSDTFSFLHDMGRRCKYTRMLLAEMARSEYVQELLRRGMTEEIDERVVQMDQMIYYLEAMEAYLSQVFQSAEKWDDHYRKGEEGEVTYRTDSFDAIYHKIAHRSAEGGEPK